MRNYSATLCLIVLFCLFFPQTSRAAHGQSPQWVDKSTDRNGNRCCGEVDCVPAESVQILEEGGGFVDIRVGGREGIIHEHALVYICPKEDRRSFICFRTSAQFQQEWRECLTKHPDGTYDAILAPSCVRCVLVPQCSGDNS